MLLIKIEVRDSPIQGLGLFAVEKANKGKLLGVFAYKADILTEQEYQEEQRKGNDVIIWSAVRWIGEIFLTGNSIGPEEHINHSCDPSTLYHCGLCFARRNIDIGDELTVDYKYFLAVDDVNKFADSQKNKSIIVDGLSPHEALIRSAKELVDLLDNSQLSYTKQNSLFNASKSKNESVLQNHLVGIVNK